MTGMKEGAGEDPFAEDAESNDPEPEQEPTTDDAPVTKRSRTKSTQKKK